MIHSLLSPTLCPLLSEKVGIELHLYQAESMRNSGSLSESYAKKRVAIHFATLSFEICANPRNCRDWRKIGYCC